MNDNSSSRPKGGLKRLGRGIWKFVSRITSVAGMLIAFAAGAGVVFAIFADDLPLGLPSPELLASIGPGYTGPYLDMHVHVAGLGYGDSGCFVHQDLVNSYKFFFYLSAFNVTKQELGQSGDQLIVERLSRSIGDSKYVNRAVVLAMDGVIDETGALDKEKTQIYVPNEYVQRETAKFPNLLFGASVNPNRKDALQQLEQVRRGGAVLIKWIPSIMDIDPADSRLVPFYEKMIELNLPLLSHTGQERSFATARDELADPLRLELPLKLGVRVIAAHIATTGSTEGVENFDRIMPLFERYPNLYADISSLTQINKLGYMASALKRTELMDRLVYGTDWPLQFFPLVSPWFHLRHLRAADMQFVGRTVNQWDRDILLKKAFGVPEPVFRRFENLLPASSGAVAIPPDSN